MYRVAVVSRWRGLCKHNPTETTPPLLPIPACHMFDLAAGGPRSSSTAQPLLSADADAAAVRRAASSSTGVVQKCLPPPRLASPRVSPGAMVLSQSIWSLPTAHRPRRRLSVRWPSPHSPAQRSLSEKGAPPGQCPPSLLRHPNLDACLSCLCRIPITDRPMRLANHGPCPLARRRVS